MKNYLRRSIGTALAATAMLALAPAVQADDSTTNKLKQDAQQAWDKTKDTAQDVYDQGKDLAQKGEKKAAEVGTNVAAKVKEGAQKVGDTVTNVAAKVKDKVDDLKK